MRKYERFFAEKRIRRLPEFQQIIMHHPDLEWIDDYQNFRSSGILDEKKCVVFAEKRGRWLKPFHCYDHPDYTYLSLDVAEGCLFDCVYCYLQTYLNHGALVIFLGLEELRKELKSLDSKQYWISTGLLSDSLLAETQFPVLQEISNVLPQNAVLELRSKSNDVGILKNDRISKHQVVISWSLNPVVIAQRYEFGTSSVEERLIAARGVVEMGYRIAFHLDPIFYFDGWRDAYRGLFSKIDLFPKDRIAFLSIGLFRYMPDLGNVIRKRFPFHPVLSGEFFLDDDGKYHYFRAIRKEMYEEFSEWIKNWKEVPVFWSMEPDQSLVGNQRDKSDQQDQSSGLS
jgi:DNA repair photolyase